MKKRGRWLLGSLFVATFVMGAAPVYGSAPGALDNSFGRGGIVQTTFSNIGAGIVLFQSNGDIVVAAANANPTSLAVESIAVIRFLPNGAVDTVSELRASPSSPSPTPRATTARPPRPPCKAMARSWS